MRHLTEKDRKRALQAKKALIPDDDVDEELSAAYIRNRRKGCLQVWKARAGVFVTYYELFLWGKQPSPVCPVCHKVADGVMHFTSGCEIFRAYYIERHNKAVDIIVAQLKEIHGENNVTNGSLGGRNRLQALQPRSSEKGYFILQPINNPLPTVGLP